MQRQYTSTAYIFQSGKVLLLYHKKHAKWMPPGGHVEANETPTETAKREALEETGVEIEIISQENLWFDHPHARSIERPYLMLLEEIPAYGESPAHQHIDFLYLARPTGMQSPKESHDVRWFTLEEVQMLKKDIEIFPDALETIVYLFQTEMALL